MPANGRRDLIRRLKVNKIQPRHHVSSYLTVSVSHLMWISIHRTSWFSLFHPLPVNSWKRECCMWSLMHTEHRHMLTASNEMVKRHLLIFYFFVRTINLEGFFLKRYFGKHNTQTVSQLYFSASWSPVGRSNQLLQCGSHNLLQKVISAISLRFCVYFNASFMYQGLFSLPFFQFACYT